MAASHFNVFVSRAHGSVDDWRKAMNAPKTELPELNEEQKEVARKMDIPEEEYARGVLVAQYGEQRQRQRGEILGQRVEEILGGLGDSYRLEAVIGEVDRGRWVVRIETATNPKNVAVPIELADDVIDSSTVQDLERLRVLLLQALGRQDLLGSTQ